jgi:hypothetical protein
MVDGREHGADQEKDQRCGKEDPNWRGDDVAAEAISGASAKKNRLAAGNTQTERSLILLSLNIPLFSAFGII